mmetsp:Transcript_9257/g.11961  ORF Transcript_9257/g.11961 Transcript_9257/m.11961 type:complete len:766 (+) Transcript_9257:83-2380(+)
MKDPVMDPEGNSYERFAILKWLEDHSTSPITRSHLRKEDLVPNRALKDLLNCSDEKTELKNNGKKVYDKFEKTKDVNPKASPLTIAMKGGFDPKENQVLIQVNPSDDDPSMYKSHSPRNLVCVLDISGSMSSRVELPGTSNEAHTDLCLLDIVKHATRTVIETLGSYDRLAIITYSDTAELIIPFTLMTASNKIHTWNVVEKIHTKGSTNIWDGLRVAMDLVREEGGDEVISSIFLLTDGLPNISPPRGEKTSLLTYLDKYPKFCCHLNTFGFGYDVNSALLQDIAEAGSGHYAFIPDSNFVGTSFINALANFLCTATTNLILNIEHDDDRGTQMKLTKCISGHNYTLTSWGMSVDIPSLKYGQKINVLVEYDGKMQQDNFLTASIDLKSAPKVLELPHHVEVEMTPFRYSDPLFDEMKIARIRSRILNLVKTFTDGSIVTHPYDRLSLAMEAIAKIKSIECSLSDYSFSEAYGALKKDLSDQVTKAYSNREWYNKWGRHYLLSLARGHTLQQCTNFKDPGLQIYAVGKFVCVRDYSEDLFVNLPPPKPTSTFRGNDVKRRCRGGRVGGCRSVASMGTFHNSSIPCFASGSVSLFDGSRKQISEIVAGDKLKTSTGCHAVTCVVASKVKGGYINLVQMGDDVIVTPWHPVRLKGTKKWHFPIELMKNASSRTKCDYVYSLVLDNGGNDFLIGNYEAVSLGHNLTEGIAKHFYLGSNKVVKDISRMDGWKNGFVELGTNPGIRDPKSGLISKLTQNKVHLHASSLM